MVAASRVSSKSWRYLIGRLRFAHHHGVGLDVRASIQFVFVMERLADQVDAGASYYGGHARLAAYACVSTRTIRKHLKRATDAGLLIRARRGGGWGKRKMSEYHLAWPGGPAEMERFREISSPNKLYPSPARRTTKTRRVPTSQWVPPAGAGGMERNRGPKRVGVGVVDDAAAEHLLREDLAAELGTSDQTHLDKVITAVLERAGGGVRSRRAYVMTAVRKDPERYRPTPVPPRPASGCDKHGHPEAASCPQCATDRAKASEYRRSAQLAHGHAPPDDPPART